MIFAGVVKYLTPFFVRIPLWMYALLLGVCSLFALPPFFMWGVLYVTCPLFMLVCETGHVKRACGRSKMFSPFMLGWSFGVGYFASGLYWLCDAVMNYGVPFWLAWCAPFFMAIGLGLFLACGLWCLFKVPYRLMRWLLFPFMWCVMAWLRGHILTGFPWNLLGYSWAGNPYLSLLPGIFGIYGSSLVLMISVMTFSAFLVVRSWLRSSFFMGFSVLMIVVAMGWGYVVKNQNQKDVSWVGVRLVAGNIPERDKDIPREWQNNLYHYMRLSVLDRPDWVKFVIWPETAVLFSIERSPSLQSILKEIVPKDGYLITGAIEREKNKDGWSLYNSLEILGQDGLIGRYDKVHLVPFGEYIPIPYVAKWIGMHAFASGTRDSVLAIPYMGNVAPLICYEAIFPYYQRGALVPQVFVNITNDAWFGNSIERAQHFYQSGVRAIEEGIPLIRVANQGGTGVFYPDGTRDDAPFIDKENGVKDVRVYIVRRATLYRVYHDKIFFGMLCVWFLICCIAGRKNVKEN